jgi:signal transduction histidine kinase
MLPLFLFGDQIRLKQILINLVKNSLKFCQGGMIRVIMAFDEDEEVLIVHVVDTGKGILPEDIDRLFKQFGKLHRTSEMNHEGIGLGLMIC